MNYHRNVTRNGTTGERVRENQKVKFNIQFQFIFGWDSVRVFNEIQPFVKCVGIHFTVKQLRQDTIDVSVVKPNYEHPSKQMDNIDGITYFHANLFSFLTMEQKKTKRTSIESHVCNWGVSACASVYALIFLR